MNSLISRNSDFAKGILRYGFAVASVAVVFAIRLMLSSYTGDRIPFTFFMFSAMISGWYGGFGPGILALVLGLLLGDYFFMEPVREIGFHKPVDVIQYVVYFLPTFLAVVLLEMLHRTTRNLEAAVVNVNSELSARREAEKQLSQAQLELRKHADDLEKRVTERTAKLQETIQTLETFSYTVAHNLRAPLRAMEGISQALIEDYSEKIDTVGQEYLRRIRTSASRMDSLICDLLGYDRVTREYRAVRPVSLDACLNSTLETMQEEILARGASVAKSGPLPEVLADDVAVKQALAHLLSNGLKFVDKGVKPCIRIYGEESGDYYRLCIQDNGIGIAAEYHKKIFGLFERLHDSTHFSGNGIGLAIVQKSIERLGGQVGLSSTPGQGSVFWIELKKAEKHK